MMKLQRPLASLVLLVILPFAISQGQQQVVVQAAGQSGAQYVTPVQSGGQVSGGQIVVSDGGAQQLNLRIGQVADVGQALSIRIHQGFPAYWGNWGQWSQCLGQCGIGYRRRQRRCYVQVTTVNGQAVVGGGGFRAITGAGGVQLGAQNVQALNSITGYGPLPAAPVLSQQLGPQYRTGCYGTLIQAQGCGLARQCVVATWSSWRQWSLCSVSCAGGRQQRVRTCSVPNGCPGVSTAYQPCNVQACVGNWGGWQITGVCTAQCGGGSQTRTRVCIGGQCVGLATDSISCNIQPCPGVWGAWTIFGACSLQCGGGSQVRTRVCTGGGNCIGIASESRACNIQPCVRYGWGIWKQWSPCSVKCGRGTSTRMRDCFYGTALADNAQGCLNLGGPVSETRPCNIECYEYGAWQEWTGCPQCGVGENRRTRQCLNLGVNRPHLNYQPCMSQGPYFEVQPCLNLPSCFSWAQWGVWSQCPPCGAGEERRTRRCVSTAGGQQPGFGLLPSFGPGNRPCLEQGGYAVESKPCLNLPSCSQWGIWGRWLGCRPGCGAGKDRRTRQCLNNGLPSLTDGACRAQGGVFFEDRDCNLGPCYGWASWGPWSLCPVTCGGSQVSRSRRCQGDGIDIDDYTKCRSAGYIGVGESQTKSCFTMPCYNWGRWERWTGCPSCGVGENRRSRRCMSGNRPHPNNRPCLDQYPQTPYFETEPCLNLPVCYSYQSWSVWSSCNPSCGAGYRNRARQCVGFNGKNVASSLCPPDGKGPSERESCQGPPCFGTYTLWTPWGPCSETCGQGQRSRQRQCSNDNCIGPSVEFENCIDRPCVTYYLAAWTDWMGCSVTCGKGYVQRTRTCLSSVGGDVLVGLCNATPDDLRETRTCTEPACVTYFLAEWSDWISCSVTCGVGVRRRSRSCTASIGGQVAVGFCNAKLADLTDTRVCEPGPCITYSWSRWDQWGQCFGVCGSGTQVRGRRCMASDGEVARNSMCPGNSYSDSRTCSLPPCVTYRLSAWSSWRSCSETCGSGFTFQSRTCLSSEGGDVQYNLCDATEDMLVNRKPCNDRPCIFYSWAGFGPFQGCSATCGDGFQIRTRSCKDNLGKDADFERCGDFSESIRRRPCNDGVCFGVYTEWSEWFPCSRTCGDGEQIRRRSCSQQPCIGEPEARRSCNLGACVFYFLGQWSRWSQCSATCGNGVTLRTRSCESSIGSDFVDSSFCKVTETALTESKSCYEGRCYDFGAWSSWTSCSAQCGEGFQRKTRVCVSTSGEQGDNTFCSSKPSDFFEQITCVKPSCPGVFLAWQTWSQCSAPCNSGTRQRIRRCPVTRCLGTSKQIEVCNEFPCRPPDADGSWSEWTRWTSCSRDEPCGVSKQTRTCIGNCVGEFERRRVCRECNRQCAVAPERRRDCGYVGITVSQCIDRGCCYDSSVLGTLWCYHEAGYVGGSFSASGSRVVVGGGGGGGGGGSSFESSSSGSVLIVTEGGKTTTTTSETGPDGKTVTSTTTSEHSEMEQSSGIQLFGGVIDDRYVQEPFEIECPKCWSGSGERPIAMLYHFCKVKGGCDGVPFLAVKYKDCDFSDCDGDAGLQ